MWTALTAALTALTVALAAPQAAPQGAPPADDIDPAPRPDSEQVRQGRAQLDETLIAGPTHLDQLAGKHLWQARIQPGDPDLMTVLRVDGGRLYVKDGANRIVCLGAKSGNEFWVADYLDPGTTVYSVNPAVRGGRDILYIVHGEGLLVVDADTGAFNSRPRTDFFPGTAAVEQGDSLIFGNGNGRIGWELLSTGVPWWSALLPGAIRTPPIIAGPVVAAASDRGGLGTWLVASSQPIWVKAHGELGPIRGAISSNWEFGGNLIFCASDDRCVYAFEHNTGFRRWKYIAENPINAPTVCIEDRVYVQIPGEGLVAFRADGGGKPGGEIAWRSPATGRVLGLFANRLLAFDDSSGTLSVIQPGDGALLHEVRGSLVDAWVTRPKDGDLFLLDASGRLQRIARLYDSPPSAPGSASAAGEAAAGEVSE